MAYRALIASGERRFGGSRQLWTTCIGLLGSWATYTYWRRVHIAHDAQLVEKHCLALAADFAVCAKGSDPQVCRIPLLKLHDCVYRHKPYNQLDFDLL